MKYQLLILGLILLIIPSTLAAMEPSRPFCERQGYDFLVKYDATYEGEKIGYVEIERTWEITYQNMTLIIPFEHNGRYIEQDGIRLDKSKINRSDAKAFCVLNSQITCDSYAFFRGECGQEFRKPLPCVKEGETVFKQFEDCCEGTRPYLRRGTVGQPTCQRLSKGFFTNNIISVSTLIGIIIVLVLIALVFFLIIKKKKIS